MGRAAGNTHFYVLGKDLFTADSVAERPPHEEHFEFLRHDGCGARNNLLDLNCEEPSARCDGPEFVIERRELIVGHASPIFPLMTQYAIRRIDQ